MFLALEMSMAHDPDPRDWLAAIIEGSEDAIVSKDLSGRIQSWNPGAQRIFGYSAEEILGQPVTILIPEDRLDEEPLILAKIRSGQRVEHFETLRRRKDGSLVEISLTISPIRNAEGVIIGASKIARDISERRHAEQRQHLLLDEIQHRVKNLFAVAMAIVSMTAREAETAEELAQNIRGRLAALARVHEMTSSFTGEARDPTKGSTLPALVETVLEPYHQEDRIVIRGPEVQLGSHATTNLALLVYELATNAAKYGALSAEAGTLTITIADHDNQVALLWSERGGQCSEKTSGEGFGSKLMTNLANSLDAEIHREWKKEGLSVEVLIPKDTLSR